MGNGYNHHKTLHHLLHHHKTTFLPMLCSKPSIKDVTIIPKCENPTSSSSSSSSSSNDPLSPRISCMGQVLKPNIDDKKFINLGNFHHKIQVSSSTTKNISPHVKYFKLKKIFSSDIKNNNNNNNNNRNCGRRRGGGNGTKNIVDDDGKENYSCGCVNIEAMDPPLPVIRKVKPTIIDGDEGDGGGVESLWKRRSGGVSLKSLRVQKIQINSHGIEQQAITF